MRVSPPPSSISSARRADGVCKQAQEKASAAEAESGKLCKQVETLEADKAKLTGDVTQLTKDKASAAENWKKWSDKAGKRKEECAALVQERAHLKRVSPRPPPPFLQLLGSPHASSYSCPASARRFSVAHESIYAGAGAGGPQT